MLNTRYLCWVAFCLNVNQYVGSYQEVQILMKKEELTYETVNIL